MVMKTPYKVKCSKCAAENLLDMELECVSSYERKMGLELEYAAAFDGVCAGCGEDITARIEAWEYPEGAIEDYVVEIEGAEQMEEPEFVMESEIFL